MRESAILEAARALGAERGIRQITLTDIGEAVGMHKSAMLRYFETREEIFLRLTADGWREWQMATPGPEVAALYRSDPRLAHAVVDVEPRVARLLAAMLEGMLGP